MRRSGAFLGPAIGRNGSDSSDESRRTAAEPRAIGRADLHVHSRHSPLCHPVVGGRSAAVPGDPDAVVAAARARGMDLFTLTDVGTIDGCLEFLDRHPAAADFFISEESIATDPESGAELHVLLYGITEAQHREIRRVRTDVRDLADFVRAAGIAASFSPFFAARPDGGWPSATLRSALDIFGLFEARNAAFSRAHNEMVARFVQEALPEGRLGVTGGSGAHGPSRAGRAATCSFARTRDGFLAELRGGRTWVGGEQGSRFRAAADLYRTVRRGERVLGGGALLIRHGIFQARLHAGITKARRESDRREILKFQEKAKSFAPDHESSGAPSHQNGTAGTGPDA